MALIDAGERRHSECVATLRSIGRPLLSTWAVFTEAMHVLGMRTGWAGQETLWEFVGREQLELADVTPAARLRVRALMTKYRDTPMALADATLVALAEERGLRRIFTLDADFAVYRIGGRRRFEIVP